MDSEKKKILIVEDEIDLLDALATALEYEGFEALKADGGKKGIEMAKDERPALAIVDISMPKVDGIEVIKRFKENDWGTDIKIIVMTALDDLEKMAEVMDAGGDEYVVKTQVTLGDIVQKVKDKLGM